jgi:hypothetical protein
MSSQGSWIDDCMSGCWMSLCDNSGCGEVCGSTKPDGTACPHCRGSKVRQKWLYALDDFQQKLCPGENGCNNCNCSCEGHGGELLLICILFIWAATVAFWLIFHVALVCTGLVCGKYYGYDECRECKGTGVVEKNDIEQPSVPIAEVAVTTVDR